MNSNTGLGPYLKNVRESKELTLRAVEKQTDISNAYLSQLEGSKIKNPSPTILHKLSELYGEPYATLMTMAGYPMPGATENSPVNMGLAARMGRVSEEEEEALVDYLQFLRSKRKRGGK